MPHGAAVAGLATAMLALAVPQAPSAARTQPAPTAAQKGLATAPLTLATSRGRFRFRVEIARTEEQQERGLMYRAPLASDRGMIFPMKPPRNAAFWMKNTPSFLDIIFIAPGGKVRRIAAMTQPFSLDAIDSGGPVESVLEIRGGRAAEIGLTPGDRVYWHDPSH